MYTEQLFRLQVTVHCAPHAPSTTNKPIRRRGPLWLIEFTWIPEFLTKTENKKISCCSELQRGFVVYLLCKRDWHSQHGFLSQKFPSSARKKKGFHFINISAQIRNPYLLCKRSFIPTKRFRASLTPSRAQLCEREVFIAHAGQHMIQKTEQIHFRKPTQKSNMQTYNPAIGFQQSFEALS